MGDSEAKKDTEPAKKAASPPAEPMKPKDSSLSVKSQKNQFAINRLVMMLMDIDPSQLSSHTIDDLKHVYDELAIILSFQKAPDNCAPKEAD